MPQPAPLLPQGAGTVEAGGVAHPVGQHDAVKLWGEAVVRVTPTQGTASFLLMEMASDRR